jgi:hypothetical protein
VDSITQEKAFVVGRNLSEKSKAGQNLIFNVREFSEGFCPRTAASPPTMFDVCSSDMHQGEAK